MEEEVEEVLSNNRIEDVSWLCSLSESELDMLISIKFLAIQRAKAIGHKNLAEKFDLKVLRALGLILMEYLKGQFKDLSGCPGLAKSAVSIDSCNLSKSGLEEIMSIEDIKECIDIGLKRRPIKKQVNFQSHNRKTRIRR